jgi:hypothetical protein
MVLFVLESWMLLIYFEFVMRFRDFRILHRLVHAQRVRVVPTANRLSSGDLCRAVDLSCVFYFRQVLCLQRSAATTLLLRNHGWPAEMVIGAQITPPKFHAWVEIEESIVNDKPYMLEMYKVLERC